MATKAELKAMIESKKGFHSIITDEIAPDNIQDDPIEKRYFYVNHTNTDGTMGKTFVYYLWDKLNDIASFYNVETEALDAKEPSADEKKFNALSAYLKSNFEAYFIGRYDLKNMWAEAFVFKLSAGKLAESKVIVFKKGTSPISHLEVVTV